MNRSNQRLPQTNSAAIPNACYILFLVAAFAGCCAIPAWSRIPTDPLANAPHARLYGRVLDSLTERPLVSATVAIPELKRGTFAARDGSFQLTGLPSGRYVVVVTMVGYAEQRLLLDLSHEEELTIRLVPETVQGSQITVTDYADGSGLLGSSNSVTVLSEADLEKTRGQTLGESLKGVAGVTLLNTGPSIAKPVIRGLHSQRVLVVNAGVQQEGQQWGAEHAPEIDPFSPSSIQVVRGPAGVEFGAGAIGGVIRLEPRPLPTTPGIDGDLTLNLFSNNRQGSGSLLLEGGLGRGLSARLQGSLRKAGDSRTPTYVLGNTGFEESNGSLTFGWQGEDAGAELLLSHFGTTLGIFRGSHVETADDLLRAIERGRPAVEHSFGYQISAPRQEVAHNSISLAAHYRSPSVGKYELQYGVQQNHRQEFDAHNRRYAGDTTGQRASSRASLDMTLTTYTLGLKLRHNGIGPLYGTIGAEGMRQGNVLDGRIFLIPQYRMYSGGIFLLENLQLGDQLLLNGGLRYDYRWTKVYQLPAKHIADTTLRYSNLTAAFGGTWSFAEAWSLNGNIGSAWRPPGVNELYSNGVHHGAAQFEIGNLGIGSERAYNVDLTLKHASEQARGQVSIYATSIDGFIYLRPDTVPTVTIRGAYPTFRYAQADALLTGIDGTIEYHLLDLLHVGATFSIVRGDNRTTNEPLIGMPGDRLQLMAHIDLPECGDWLGSPYIEPSVQMVRSQTRTPVGADYAPPPAGYTLFNLDAGARLRLFSSPITLAFSVQNIFNKSYRDYLSRYRYFSDDPGRNLVLRVGIAF
ncbi:MAG: TonB-dependent receptor [Candidatus Kapabacteria bacterium]|nr:TonB-dependent receptor [Candidatus Kapabacteria bacterium]